jgi:hypothetical protein
VGTTAADGLTAHWRWSQCSSCFLQQCKGHNKEAFCKFPPAATGASSAGGVLHVVPALLVVSVHLVLHSVRYEVA